MAGGSACHLQKGRNNSDEKVWDLLRKMKKRYEEEDKADESMAFDGSAKQKRRRSKLPGLFDFSYTCCNGGGGGTRHLNVRAKVDETEPSMRSIHNPPSPETGECTVGSRHLHQCSDGDETTHQVVDNDEGSRVASVYHKFSAHLRLCFLYLGLLFPVEQTISARQLIQIWMAEGFMDVDEEAEGDDNYAVTASRMEEFLEELIKGNCVKVDARRAVDGGVKSFQTTSHFRECCVDNGAELHAFEVFANADADASQFRTPREGETTTPTRRAVYRKQLDLSWEAKYYCPRLRSLHYFLSDASEDANSTPSVSHNYRHYSSTIASSLRVLNLGAVKLDKVPLSDSVGSLIHLRYLRINAPSLRLIPPSIWKIPNLQTLDMRETVSCAVPDGIWKMHSLRHLYFGCSHAQLATARSSGIRRNGNRSLFLEQLQKLQTLSGIQPNRVLKRLMVTAKFPNVSKLRLCSSDADETLEFLKSLDHLYYLQSLRLMGASTLPDPHAFPGALAKVTLLNTKLDDGGIQTLEKLPNLRVLKLLEKSISVEEICCGEGGFPQLQVLHLVNLQAKRWSNGRGGMRSLQHLVIKDCNQLAVIPSVRKLLTLSIIPEETGHRLTRRGSKMLIPQHQRSDI